MPSFVTIALGSNLGESQRILSQVAIDLRRIADPSSPFLQAPLYLSEPVGCPPGSPKFYNSAVAFEYEGTPESLLANTQAIEAKYGRPKEHGFNTPRTADVDILTFGQISLSTGDLTLPHPRLNERLFVLEPLAQICPDLTPSGQTASISELLKPLKATEAPLTLVATDW